MWVPKTLMFAGTCSARSVLTLVSQRITRRYRTRQITCRFPVGTLNLLTLTPYLSGDDEAPAAGAPAGIKLLQDYGQVASIRADGEQIVLDHMVSPDTAGSYLKIYAVNTDFYAHAVDVDITIEVEMEGGE